MYRMDSLFYRELPNIIARNNLPVRGRRRGGVTNAKLQTARVAGMLFLLPMTAFDQGFATFGISAARGAPFSAIRETVFTGNQFPEFHVYPPPRRVPVVTLMRDYRDFEGRTRRESFFPASLWTTGMPSSIEIFDPVLSVTYMLDPKTHVAERLRMAWPGRRLTPPPGGNACTNRESSEPQAGATPLVPVIKGRLGSSRASLGTREMEGVLAEGSVTMSTIPAGTGWNTTPVYPTTKSWVSRILDMTIYQRTYDPLQQGVTVDRLRQIKCVEPDPALFRVPAGYKIVNTAQ